MEVYQDETKGEIPGYFLRNSVVPTVVRMLSMLRGIIGASVSVELH